MPLVTRIEFLLDAIDLIDVVTGRLRNTSDTLFEKIFAFVSTPRTIVERAIAFATVFATARTALVTRMLVRKPAIPLVFPPTNLNATIRRRDKLIAETDEETLLSRITTKDETALAAAFALDTIDLVTATVFVLDGEPKLFPLDFTALRILMLEIDLETVFPTTRTPLLMAKRILSLVTLLAIPEIALILDTVDRETDIAL
jgi:hypothetical protein